MKYLIIIALVLGAISSKAQTGFPAFAAGGTRQNGTNFVVVPSQTTLPNAQPLVTYLSATGTNTAAVLNFWFSTNQTKVLFTNNATTITVGSTNGFTANTVIVVQHSGLNALLDRVQYERLQVSSVANTNQIVLVNAPLNTIQTNDVVYQETLMSSLPIGNATVTLTGPGVVSGFRGKPWLIDEGGSTNTTINAINIQFNP